MRVYLIKHKGASIWQNMHINRKITLSNGNEIYCGLVFFRKKDAQAYLNTLDYKEYSEVIAATVDKSKDDNRKNVIKL